MKKHLQNEATKMISDWNRDGFNGIRFEVCQIQPHVWEDWKSDGRTRQEYDAHVESYASFIAQPIIETVFVERHAYESYSVDVDQFMIDLNVEIKRRLGDDVEIEYRPNCHEFEITENK